MIKTTYGKVALLLLSSFTLSNATDSHLELSFVKTSGNTESTILSSKYKTKQDLTSKDIIKLDASILYNKTEEDTSANKYYVELYYNRMLSDKLYTYLGGSYIKDEQSEFDYRLNVGPGYGYKLLNDDIHKLDVEAGVDYAYDNYSYADNEWYLAGKTKLDYSYQLSYGTKFNQMASYLFSLDDPGKYFVVSESSIQTKMTQNFSMAITYRLDYTNDTIQDEKKDEKILTSIIYDF